MISESQRKIIEIVALRLISAIAMLIFEIIVLKITQIMNLVKLYLRQPRKSIFQVNLTIPSLKLDITGVAPTLKLC